MTNLHYTWLSACPSGFYCEEAGLTNASGPCQQGYHCISGAKTANPDDKVTGIICPVGYYCPTATNRTVPCENGTYMNTTGEYNIIDIIR